MRSWRIMAAAVMLCGIVASTTLAADPALGAPAVPSGFTLSTVADGFEYPTSFVIAPDGSVFITEKRGQVLKLDSINDPTPTLVADMRLKTHNHSDRGMTGLAVDPNYPAEPYVYVGYAVDKAPFGGTIPTYGHVGGSYDPCPESGTTGCPVVSRVSRLDMSNGAAEQVLFEGHCQQFPFHSVGDLVFDESGYLLASFGDGSTGSFNEYGQRGNPCGDPGGPIGSNLSSPTTEGGQGRAQDVLTRTDPTDVAGSILRVNPDNFNAVASNPMSGDPEANVARMIGTGFRNPFRMAVDPANGRIYVGNVGGAGFEEIQLIEDSFVNGGWPCYEGDDIQANHFWSRTSLCEQLIDAGDHDAPLFTYTRDDRITPGENCPTGGLSVSGLAVNRSGFGDTDMHGGVFFTDYTRACIWYLPAGANGRPDPSNPTLFATDIGYLVDLAFGPDGALYGMDIVGGKLIRISEDNAGQNQAPVAIFSPSVSSGPAPLSVDFDARASYDPDPNDTLSFRWDFNDDGVIDAFGRQVSRTFTNSGQYDVRLRVVDQDGRLGSVTHQIVVGGVPTAVMNQPADGRTFAVGGVVPLHAEGHDAGGAPLPDSAYEWEFVLHHCIPGSSCHTHGLDAANGPGGSISMPDHEYPSNVEFLLTVTDSHGVEATESRVIEYQTVDLDVYSRPSGAEVLVGSTAESTPFTRVVAKNATTSLSVNPSQNIGGIGYLFGNWTVNGQDLGTNLGLELIPSQDTPVTAVFGVNNVVDTERPSAPSRLYTSTPGAGIPLVWTGSTDNVGVTNYLIYRSTNGSFGSWLTTVGNVTSWTDTSAVPGVTYTYGVKARDAAGNTSWRGNLATRRMPGGAVDTERPSAPSRLYTSTPGAGIPLVWTGSTDNVGVTNYLIYRSTNGSFGSWLTTVGNVTSWTDTSAVPGVTYTYGVKARDAAGNTSWRGNLATRRMPGGAVDTERPTTPRNLRSDQLGSDVVLRWIESVDNVGVAGYEIYRSTNGTLGSRLTTVGAISTWTDTNVIRGVTYTYAVKAIDAAGNRSSRTNLSAELVE